MRSVRRHLRLLPNLVPGALSLGLSLVLVACAAEEASPPADAPSTPGAASLPQEQPPTPAPGSRARVVTLGTSLTAGLGLDDPAVQAWPARLAARADTAGTPIEVVNAGVSGDTSAGGLRRLDWILRDPVDLLVVELGANDGLRGLPVEEMEANLDSVFARTRDRWPDAALALVPMEAPPNLGPDYTDAVRAVFPAVARRWNATLLPFILDGIAGVPELNQDDGIHPTAEGHRRMVANVWPALAPLISDLETGR